MEVNTVVLSPDDLERLVKIETIVEGIKTSVEEMRRYIPTQCIETHGRITALENTLSELRSNLNWALRTAGAAVIVAVISMVIK